MGKIVIVTSGYLPVPASKGGAVETLLDNIVKQNEKNHNLDLTIITCYDQLASEKSKDFKYTKYCDIKIPRVIEIIDKAIFFFSSKILNVSKPSSYRYIIQRVYFIKKTTAHLGINDYDKVIIENNATLFSIFKRKSIKEKYSGKYMLHLHNEINNTFGNYKEIAETNKVIGVSNYINQTFNKKFPNVSKKRYTVLRNAVDSGIFNSTFSNNEILEFRSQFDISEDDFVFLYSGRLSKEKGIMELVQAFKNMPKRARLLVVGNTFFGTDIKSTFHQELIREAKSIESRILFSGFIPNERMGIVYASANACVFPSIWEDPAPLTVIEAINCGKAIITTNSGGIPEYVNDKNAMIINRDEKIVSSLVVAMKKIMEDKKLLKEMEANSLTIAKGYDLKQMYSQLCEILNN